MKSFAVDANNDLYLDAGGSLAFANNVAAVLNVCQHVAQAIRNEMVFAQPRGLPDFQAVWNGAPKLSVWEAAFRSRIAKVKGVIGIQSLDISQVGDTLKYDAVILTLYGEGALNG